MPRRKRDAPVVDVSSDAAEIARIREAAASADPPEASGLPRVALGRLIDLLDRVMFDEREMARTLGEATEEHRSRLRAKSAGEGGATGGARANATILLGLLGEPDAGARLTTLLSVADLDVFQAALAELVRNFRLARTLLIEPTVAAAIDSSMSRPPASIRALQIRLLLDPLAEVPAPVVQSTFAAGAASTDRETAEAARSVLHQVLRRGHPAEARVAALLLLQSAVPLPPGSSRSHDVWAAARAAGPEALDSLEALSAGADPEPAREALHALARLRGREVLPRVVPRLDDPKQRGRAADAIGMLFAGTVDATMIRRLTEVALADTDARNAAALAQALVRISGRLARATAVGLVSRLYSNDRQRLLWALEGITLTKAVEAAAETGLVASPPDEQEWSYLRSTTWADSEDDVALLWTLLHHRKAVFVFDVETSYPPRHQRLVTEAAAMTRGLLAPEAAMQTGSPEGIEQGQPAYRLSFLSEGRAYQVSCRQNGDYYDSEAVLAAVHRALADKGREERFVPIGIGGQDAHFIFGPPDAVHAFCDRVFIPYGDRERNESVVHALKDRLGVGLR
jgi:hypothetical protein